MELNYVITPCNNGGYNLWNLTNNRMFPLPFIRSRYHYYWFDIYGGDTLFSKLLTAYILMDIMPQYDVRDILGSRSHYKEVLAMLECS